MSPNNLGTKLSDQGRREEALAGAQEAVDIYRRLTQGRPDAFLPDLAAGLNNLGVTLSDLGRRAEALATAQEAVDIRRWLAQGRPDAFLPDLARSLSVLSDALASLDSYREAASAATEALTLLLPFLERYPGPYRDLAIIITEDVRRYSKAAGQMPDAALLERVTRASKSGAR
jgi:tetratricopeptide (TPR) repeat protein